MEQTIYYKSLSPSASPSTACSRLWHIRAAPWAFRIGPPGPTEPGSPIGSTSFLSGSSLAGQNRSCPLIGPRELGSCKDWRVEWNRYRHRRRGSLDKRGGRKKFPPSPLKLHLDKCATWIRTNNQPPLFIQWSTFTLTRKQSWHSAQLSSQSMTYNCNL